jgi:hypothetical protein
MLISKKFATACRNAPAALSEKPQKPRKKYKCKVCREMYERRNSMQIVCGPKCAHAWADSIAIKAAAQREQEERKKTKARLIELKPRKWWLAKAKKALHEYIRTRDEGKPCISCDSILVRSGRLGGDYDAGHFRAVGSAKHLEFVEENIHGQCKHCNDYLKGNRDGYEDGLIGRFGIDYVEALKNDNAPRHLTIQDFQEIERKYKALTKQLLADKEVAQ